jgi:hypothetical protein
LGARGVVFSAFRAHGKNLRAAALLKHRYGYLIPCAILGLLPVLCLGSDVKAFGAKDADYSYYKTFCWLPSKMLTKAGVVEGDPTVALPDREFREEPTREKGTHGGGARGRPY